MKNLGWKLFALMFGLGFMGAESVALAAKKKAKKTPVAMLTQVKGDVQYSKKKWEKKGKWKKVRRNKMVFSTFKVKTGADGSLVIVNQKTQKARDLGPNSEIVIGNDGATLVSGNLSDPRDNKGGVSASLGNKFKKAQRYTTVRRAVDKNKGKKPKLKLIKKVNVSAAYPNLVWEGLGAGYSYNIIIDGQAHKVPATTEKIVTFVVPELSAGKHGWKVNVITDIDREYKGKKDMISVKAGETVIKMRKERKLNYIAGKAWDKYLKGEAEVKAAMPEDDFFLASYMEEQGFAVAAMEHYRKYFEANHDENEMRPMLVQAYHTLKLKKMKKAEAQIFNEQEAEG